MPSAEVCNGIDDDCDGLVDEGCPCTQSITTLPGSSRSAVSLGVGFGVQLDFDYVQLDDDLNVVSQVGSLMATASMRQVMAWDGHEVAFYTDGGGGGGALELFGPDGSALHTGPSLGGTNFGQGIVQWNGTGFDVAAIDFDHIAFVRTDVTGAPITSLATSTP